MKGLAVVWLVLGVAVGIGLGEALLRLV